MGKKSYLRFYSCLSFSRAVPQAGYEARGNCCASLHQVEHPRPGCPVRVPAPVAVAVAVQVEQEGDQNGEFCEGRARAVLRTPQHEEVFPDGKAWMSLPKARTRKPGCQIDGADFVGFGCRLDAC